MVAPPSFASVLELASRASRKTVSFVRFASSKRVYRGRNVSCEFGAQPAAVLCHSDYEQ